MFFRAMRACPSSKQLWTTAFGSEVLCAAMAKTELTELISLMEEKELRLHHSVDSVSLPFFQL